MTEMGYGYLVTNPTLMLGDNAQADRWAREAMITNGNRHIERDFHKIKEAVEQNHIEPRKIKGEDNTSDMFTKPVSKEVTEKLIGMLRGADGLKVGDHDGGQHFHHARHQVRSPPDNVLVIRTYFCINPNYVAVKSDVLDDTAVKNNVLDIRM